jgi:NAD(P)H-dependent flavin oxidoreductase YrpB (nitropropane dioxygenase family)
MGVAVSGWRLARAVASRGGLGVVSGTALDTVLVRRLEDGDQGEHVRRAMTRFPLQRVVTETLAQHFNSEGREEHEPYTLLPLPRRVLGRAREELMMLAAFVEVSLAKEGHHGPVGMNLLTKVQIPNLALLYGAMLAGVDFVLMGAGIPREIPGALDALAEHRPALMRFDLDGAVEPEWLQFDPNVHFEAKAPEVARPKFLAIVSSHSLATMLTRKATGRVDGFVIEGPTAGGHNAPPRGDGALDARGQPIYGPRDEVDLARFVELGVPFWLAGGKGHPADLRHAREAGAAGIQVGTLFAYCDESGLDPATKRTVLEAAVRGDVDVRTDPRASPTGFPFKVVRWNSGSAPSTERARVCDLGYLRTAFKKSTGAIGYRCPSEPIDTYVASGGRLADTEGRMCLCNGLFAAVGYAQPREGGFEPPLVTSGDDLVGLTRCLGGRTSYTASEALDYLYERGQFCRS